MNHVHRPVVIAIALAVAALSGCTRVGVTGQSKNPSGSELGAQYTQPLPSTPITDADSKGLSNLLGKNITALKHVKGARGDYYVFADGNKRICAQVTNHHTATIYRWTSKTTGIAVNTTPLGGPVNSSNIVVCGHVVKNSSLTITTNKTTRTIDFKGHDANVLYVWKRFKGEKVTNYVIRP